MSMITITRNEACDLRDDLLIERNVAMYRGEYDVARVVGEDFDMLDEILSVCDGDTVTLDGDLGDLAEERYA